MTAVASVLVVCLGNICRSPLAEAALRREAEMAGLDLAVDSAGTGDWHRGQPPDPRAVAEARRHDIDIARYRARQVTKADFARFDLILAADLDNLAALRRIAPAGHHAQLALLMDMVAGCEGEAVADPYFGDARDFETTWADVSRAAASLIARLAG